MGYLIRNTQQYGLEKRKVLHLAGLEPQTPRLAEISFTLAPIIEDLTLKTNRSNLRLWSHKDQARFFQVNTTAIAQRCLQMQARYQLISWFSWVVVGGRGGGVGVGPRGKRGGGKFSFFFRFSLSRSEFQNHYHAPFLLPSRDAAPIL